MGHQGFFSLCLTMDAQHRENPKLFHRYKAETNIPAAQESSQVPVGIARGWRKNMLLAQERVG